MFANLFISPYQFIKLDNFKCISLPSKNSVVVLGSEVVRLSVQKRNFHKILLQSCTGSNDLIG